MPSNLQNEITQLDALELSSAIKHKRYSCLEVMQAYLQHIKLENPTYNALVSLLAEEKLYAQAKQADDDLIKGKYRGWMHGFPHAIKDLAATKGILTTFGSELFKHSVPDYDDEFVRRIRQAGAIIIGKTNTPEFGLGSQTYNSVHGTTVNAFDSSLCAGGSSGGAAVALARQMLPVADGSDMMGSLRNPAAFNNIIGFRPSRGRVPSTPADEIFYSDLSCSGPMGRNVKDTTQLLFTMAGFDKSDPNTSLANLTEVNFDRYNQNLKNIKIGWMGDFNGYLAIEEGIMDVCKNALQTFENLNAVVEDVAIDFPLEMLWQAWVTLRQFSISGKLNTLYKSPENHQFMKPELIWEIQNGLKLSSQDIYQAASQRTLWFHYINHLFEHYDFLVLPSAQVFAFDSNIHWPKQINQVTMDTYHRWMEIVIAGTLSACPVINVPAGFDKYNRAMGIQIIAPLNHDIELLEVAYCYEKAADLLKIN